jgi:hypothetical protein
MLLKLGVKFINPVISCPPSINLPDDAIFFHGIYGGIFAIIEHL